MESIKKTRLGYLGSEKLAELIEKHGKFDVTCHSKTVATITKLGRKLPSYEISVFALRDIPEEWPDEAVIVNQGTGERIGILRKIK